MVLLHDRTATDRLIVWSAQPLNAETPAQVLSRCPITPVDNFLVRNHGAVPALDPANYLLPVGGYVRVPLCLSLAELREGFEPVTVPGVCRQSPTGTRLDPGHRPRGARARSGPPNGPAPD